MNRLYSDPRMEALALFFFSLVLMEMISQNDWCDIGNTSSEERSHNLDHFVICVSR